MELELKIGDDDLGKVIILPGRDNYSAHLFNETPQGMASLTAIVDGRKLISHYEKVEDVWIKTYAIRSGPVVIGHNTYEKGTTEYEAFEMLNRT